MHRLLILSKDHEEYRHLIEDAKIPDLVVEATNIPAEGSKIGGSCDILFGEPSLISQIISELPDLKWVQSSWAGVEPLIRAGAGRKFVLTNARNVYGEMMSEFVFGYLLLIERKILQRWQAQNERRWDNSPHGMLKGKLIGLLGVGTIGARLAKTAHHFGMRVHGYTRQSESCQEVDHYYHTGEILEFARDLDYLVCCLPGTPATESIINSDFLSAIPSKTWLINIGRGSTMDEPALVTALNHHSLAGAILDVFVEEPLPLNHPFWQTPNTYITCHTAAKNYPPDIAALFLDNYKRWSEGKQLLYQVDFDQQY